MVPVQSYPKGLDVIQDMVIKGEVIAWDDVDTGILLYLPMLETKALALI